ncbi:MAG: tRNA pseudouridine(55) synthase TruB [Bacteroidia bacterium]|nr:tRNA pseudouridine(55) synthase TruB [Bacteroidia bacterium]
MTKANFDKDKFKSGAILLFDKPINWSSFRLVKRVRFSTKASKVGHAGTLDPLATGLLVIATGKCTRMIERIQSMPKIYTGVFNFGKTTPSYDLETPFDAEFPYLHINSQMIDKAVLDFTGEINQVPPVFSAIKINGTRAYEFARQGQEVELKSRKVMIHNFKVDGQLPQLNFEVMCSKGTYIRTIAHDFGLALQSGCYLTDLKRTAIGDFKIEDAFQIDEFQELCNTLA